jgi:hypothetical protein
MLFFQLELTFVLQERNFNSKTMKTIMTQNPMHAMFMTITLAITLSCSSDEAEFVPEIGLEYGGGIIVYVDDTDQHGLIAATTDQGVDVAWGCEGIYISVPGSQGTSTAVGSGKANTEAIVFNCQTPGIAARLCDELSMGGYDDWFLPSLDELQLLYEARILPGLNLEEAHYWSSSQANDFNAYFILFYNGTQSTYNKDQSDYRVRAIRTF